MLCKGDIVSSQPRVAATRAALPRELFIARVLVHASADAGMHDDPGEDEGGAGGRLVSRAAAAPWRLLKLASGGGGRHGHGHVEHAVPTEAALALWDGGKAAGGAIGGATRILEWDDREHRTFGEVGGDDDDGP